MVSHVVREIVSSAYALPKGNGSRIPGAPPKATLVVLGGHSYTTMGSSVLEVIETNTSQPANFILTAVTTAEGASHR